MALERIGVTYLIPEGHEPIPVYDSGDGVPVFITDEPYLLSDGLCLESPIPVVDAGGPTWLARDGSLQAAWAVSGLTPPEPEENAVTVDGIPVTHNGEIVTHAGT